MPDSTITPELLEQLLANYEKPEDLTAYYGQSSLERCNQYLPKIHNASVGNMNGTIERKLRIAMAAQRNPDAYSICEKEEPAC